MDIVRNVFYLYSLAGNIIKERDDEGLDCSPMPGSYMIVILGKMPNLCCCKFNSVCINVMGRCIYFTVTWFT